MIALPALAVIVGLAYMVAGWRIDAPRLGYAGLGATFVAVVWFGFTLFELVTDRREP